MKQKLIFIFLIFFSFEKIKAQNISLNTDTTIINGDTIIGDPITFTKYDNRFVDLMFFDGNYNIVVFKITENNECYQLMLSSADSSTFCFQVTGEQFNQLMSLVTEMKMELEQQPEWPVKCKYCQTLQMFWYEGDVERSTLKRAYLIPPSFNELLDYCYDISSEKKRCSIQLNTFKSLQGFEDHLRGPVLLNK